MDAIKLYLLTVLNDTRRSHRTACYMASFARVLDCGQFYGRIFNSFLVHMLLLSCKSRPCPTRVLLSTYTHRLFVSRHTPTIRHIGHYPVQRGHTPAPSVDALEEKDYALLSRPMNSKAYTPSHFISLIRGIILLFPLTSTRAQGAGGPCKRMPPMQRCSSNCDSAMPLLRTFLVPTLL